MASPVINIPQLRTRLSGSDSFGNDGFEVLRDIACVVNTDRSRYEAQELILRAMDRRDAFGRYTPMLDALVREVGLFPYLDPDQLHFADRLAYEVFRANNLGEDIVFHRPQAQVFWTLMAGENVVLSAPTSFGKSLIIDAAIASGRYKNVLVIVPTIALIDETRRRLTKRFRGQYHVITHQTQERGERTLFVFTQERYIEAEIENIDFFVIDEFYKLGPGRTDDDDRCMLLNQVLYRLLKTGAQFYMLGPNIEGLTDASSESLKYRGFIERYRTVVAEIHDYRGKGNDLDRLVALCQSLHDPTIIFCRSPARCAEVANKLIEAGINRGTGASVEASEWVADNFHPDWHVAKAIRAGIGVHHSRIPRALAQYVVRGFNTDELQFLVCTSTLIEGVNTKAKNIIIFDAKINKQPIDFFTFNNIQGRSGRMGQHYIGHVYLFHAPPEESLPFVEVPVFTQSEKAPGSLLIQMDEPDLTTQSKERLKPYSDQEVVSYETLRSNNGVDLDAQLALAKEIAGNPRRYSNLFAWSRFPTYDQLVAVCSVMWTFFKASKLAAGSVANAKQLAVLIFALRDRPTTKEMIAKQMLYWKDADKSVSTTLDFLRLWATFHFSRLLMAIDRIQKDVLGRAKLRAGNFEPFAAAVESLFMDSTLVALEEYGLPIEIARKLEDALQPDGDLDGVLGRLKAIDVDGYELTSFEVRMIVAVQDGI
jgi:rhodanese-related sulfurtransferase